MASVIFTDHSAVANPSGDLIKVAFTMKTGDKESADTGTVVLTQWAALQMVASVYEALKNVDKQRQATVVDMKKAKAKLSQEPAFK